MIERGENMSHSLSLSRVWWIALIAKLHADTLQLIIQALVLLRQRFPSETKRRFAAVCFCVFFVLKGEVMVIINCGILMKVNFYKDARLQWMSHINCPPTQPDFPLTDVICSVADFVFKGPRCAYLEFNKK